VATILAAGEAGEKALSIIVTCLMLIGAFLVLGVGIWYIRRWQRGGRDSAAAPWSLDDLRKLRDQGQLTEAEYQALRAEMIGMYTGRGQTQSEIPSAEPQTKDGQAPDQEWDWIADNDPPSGGFDVKRQSPG